MADITANTVQVLKYKKVPYWAIKHDSNSHRLYNANGHYVGLLLNRQGRLSIHPDQPGGNVLQKIPDEVLKELGALE